MRSVCLAAASALFLSVAPANEPPPPVGSRAEVFTLPDTATGKPWALADHARDATATVVFFTGTECPVSNAYVPRLVELHKSYAGKGVVLVAVNSLATDTAADAAKHAKAFGLPFPVLKDDGTKLADRFKVERTPAAIVLDAGRVVRYAGRIDDQYTPTTRRPAPTTNELTAALDAVLAGRDVPTAAAPPAGCLLTREKKVKVEGGPTYHRDIARVFQAKCQECHRPGEAGPFSLTSYKQAKGWADMIREVVATDVMPPWHADAKPGHFVNDRRLTDAEKKTILAWVDQGCAEGDAAETPAPRQFVTGWRLGREPDEVFRMNDAFAVPATAPTAGGVRYQYVLAGEPFKEDKWVTAVEVRPEYRAVVHHVIVFILPPDGNPLNAIRGDFGRNMLGAFVPGDQPTILPPGMARKIVKGSRLLFEVHYTPNGKAGTDRSMVGVLYTKDAPKYTVANTAVANNRFTIPAGATGYEVKSVRRFDKPVTILSLTPHMHVRGAAFRHELVTPDGTREVLLNVPKYDFNWQATYTLAKPREVPAGSRIECTAWFDNSTANPSNPDPKKEVRWGNQTWQEMMIGFVVFYEQSE